MASLTVYDGANAIFGNRIYLEENGQGEFLDFGKNFDKYILFYEEFLKNCDTRGIHALLYLNRLPSSRSTGQTSFPLTILPNDIRP